MATQVTSAEMIPEITARIVRAFHPEKIILFGSHARGEARADSDVDLRVVFGQIADKHAATVNVQRLFSNLTIGVDVVVTTGDEIESRRDELGFVVRPALREGKVVYGGS